MTKKVPPVYYVYIVIWLQYFLYFIHDEDIAKSLSQGKAIQGWSAWCTVATAEEFMDIPTPSSAAIKSSDGAQNSSSSRKCKSDTQDVLWLRNTSVHKLSILYIYIIYFVIWTLVSFYPQVILRELWKLQL